ncbi:MAG: flagellar motor switch protein FliN [Nitrospirota bacterium]|nr:flagellar motor switch protein FliN [Nitrospirota bacterium]
MSEDESVDLDTFDAEKEMMEALAQEAAAKPAGSGETSMQPSSQPSPSVPPSASLGSQDSNLDRILDIPLVLSAQLGNTRMLIKDLLQLGPGSIVELDKLAGEPLEVLVNERLVARGEVVMVNEKFGIRLTDVISATERVKKLH